jgi:hypothetical protein
MDSTCQNLDFWDSNLGSDQTQTLGERNKFARVDNAIGSR